MKIIIEDSVIREMLGTGLSRCEVMSETALTASEVVDLMYRCMLGFGFQKESIVYAMETIVEEYGNG